MKIVKACCCSLVGMRILVAAVGKKKSVLVIQKYAEQCQMT